MKLKERIKTLVQLGTYMKSADEHWATAKEKAYRANNWFIPEFINLSVENIARQFLKENLLQELAASHAISEENRTPKKVGLVMAGNIPLVGFHDLLCTFLAGHYAYIKPSSKDEVLVKHLVQQIIILAPQASFYFILAERLNGCDAYIATGSNNSSRYFDYYFGKYPHIIRRNRTSVAILTGEENKEELEKLADDVHQYFGLGCRNVTKLYVPKEFDFIPLLAAFKKYDFFENHNKFKNNYDHNLAMLIINNRYYMTNGSTVLLVEEKAPFSAIAQLHYEYYTDVASVEEELNGNDAIQCIVGKNHTAFGEAQCPQLHTYADGVDTTQFLVQLSKNKTEEVRKP